METKEMKDVNEGLNEMGPIAWTWASWWPQARTTLIRVDQTWKVKVRSPHSSGMSTRAAIVGGTGEIK